jgi:hypothetical protein
MTNYFVFRTTDDEKERIWQDIQEGRLRQGWGLSKMELPSGEDTPDKKADWCQRFRAQGEPVWKEEISTERAEKRYDRPRKRK